MQKADRLNLAKFYQEEVVPQLMEKFGYRNKFEVPKIEKVIVSTCFGKLIVSAQEKERKKIENSILKDLSLICGQKPKEIKAKKSISGFSLKKGMTIAYKVTLRKKRMYDFLERLISYGLARVRDFEGFSEKNFDEKGNLNIGLKDQICFPEISIEKEKILFGLQITIVTTAKTKKEAIALLEALRFPIKE